jgi:hypothetical protein
MAKQYDKARSRTLLAVMLLVTQRCLALLSNGISADACRRSYHTSILKLPFSSTLICRFCELQCDHHLLHATPSNPLHVVGGNVSLCPEMVRANRGTMVTCMQDSSIK